MRRTTTPRSRTHRAGHSTLVLGKLCRSGLRWKRHPLLVPLLVQAGRPATGAAAPATTGRLVGLLRDDMTNASFPQVGRGTAIAVSLVRADAVRCGAGPTGSQARHPDPFHDRLEPGAVRPLPGSDEHRQRAAATVRAQVEFGGETPRERPSVSPPAPPPPGGRSVPPGSERSRPPCQSPFGTRWRRQPGAGRVPVGSHGGRFHGHIPVDVASRVSLGLDPLEEQLPGAVR